MYTFWYSLILLFSFSFCSISLYWLKLGNWTLLLLSLFWLTKLILSWIIEWTKFIEISIKCSKNSFWCFCGSELELKELSVVKWVWIYCINNCVALYCCIEFVNGINKEGLITSIWPYFKPNSNACNCNSIVLHSLFLHISSAILLLSNIIKLLINFVLLLYFPNNRVCIPLELIKYQILSCNIIIIVFSSIFNIYPSPCLRS